MMNRRGFFLSFTTLNTAELSDTKDESLAWQVANIRNRQSKPWTEKVFSSFPCPFTNQNLHHVYYCFEITGFIIFLVSLLENGVKGAEDRVNKFSLLLHSMETSLLRVENFIFFPDSTVLCGKGFPDSFYEGIYENFSFIILLLEFPVKQGEELVLSPPNLSANVFASFSCSFLSTFCHWSLSALVKGDLFWGYPSIFITSLLFLFYPYSAKWDSVHVPRDHT